MNILLIDDEKDFTDLISTLLSFQDLQSKAINHPAQIDNILKNEVFSLIVTDLMMPETSGFDIIAKLRAHPQYTNTPLIALSAKQLSDEDRKFLLQNNVHFMSKPFEPLSLVEQIRHILGNQ